jgi:putative peptidoglycan lipid II flippase
VGVATMMTAGSVSVFQFAFNLQSVPLAIIGMSYSVAAFPVLADYFAKKDQGAFNEHVLTALRHIVFWSLPVIALVIVLRAQIVRVVLGSGAFDWSDTRLTAAVLALFIIGLTAQSVLLLIIRTFYAGGKTKIPLLVAMGGASVSIIFAFVSLKVINLYPELKAIFESAFRLEGVAGTEVLVLAIAFVLGVIIEMVVLLFMSAKVFGIKLKGVINQFLEALIASLVAAGAAYGTLVFIVEGIDQNTFIGILLQGFVAGVIGVIACAITYHLLGSKELKEICLSIHSRVFRKNLVAPQQDTL